MKTKGPLRASQHTIGNVVLVPIRWQASWERVKIRYSWIRCIGVIDSDMSKWEKIKRNPPTQVCARRSFSDT